MALENLLGNFHRAILENNAAPALLDISPNQKIAAAQQMAIYIDGYRIRLVQAIRSDYPTLLGLLGDAEFDRLALEYIENNPPTSFNLDRYPHNFAGFLAGKIDAFAIEVAALEGAIAEVFMMPESEALMPAALANIAPEEIGNIILKPRAAAKLLRFEHDVNGWLNKVRAGKIAGNMRPQPEGEGAVYIYRHENNVQRAALSGAEYAVLRQIFSGLKLEDALEKAMDEQPEYAENIGENIQDWFTKWTSCGFFSSIAENQGA